MRDLITPIFHLFKEYWEREWVGPVCSEYPYPAISGYREKIVFVEKCKICGKRRAFWIGISGKHHKIDMDHLIVSSAPFPKRLPYSFLNHEPLFENGNQL